MRRSGRLLLALSLMSVPATAGAQELLPSCPNKQNITADDKTNALNLERAGNDTVTPTGRTASLLKGLAGEMEVNNGEARTSISYGDKLAPRICPADADGAVRFRQTSYGFTLSVPLANDTDRSWRRLDARKRAGAAKFRAPHLSKGAGFQRHPAII